MAAKKQPASPRKKSLLIGLFSIVLLLALLFGKQMYKSQTITLGLNAELSGELSAVGQSSKHGTELAIKEVNDNGGIMINGKQHKLRLIVADNGSTEKVTKAATEELIKANTLAIIGPNASKFAIAAADVAEKEKTLLISPWSTNPLTTQLDDGTAKRYIFRTAYLDPFQSKSLADFAYHSLQARQAAVIYDETADVLTKQADYFINAFTENGGNINFQLTFDPKQTNYQELVRTLAGYHADVIVLPAYYKEAAAFIQATKAQGITTPILGTDAWESNKILPLCGDACNGSLLSAHFSAADPNDKTQQFVASYQSTYGETPDDVAALSYDSVGLLVKALENCNCTTREGIVAGMHLIQQYSGVTGVMTFPPESNDPIKSVMILQIQDGKLQFKEQITPF